MADYSYNNIISKAWDLHKNFMMIGGVETLYNWRMVFTISNGFEPDDPILTYHEESNCNYSIMEKIPAEAYASYILGYYSKYIAPYDLMTIYKFYTHEKIDNLSQIESSNMNKCGIKLLLIDVMNTHMIFPIENFEDEKKDKLTTELKEIFNLTYNLRKEFEEYQQQVKINLTEAASDYEKSYNGISKYVNFFLSHSLYGFNFHKDINSEYRYTDKCLIIDYTLPNKGEIPTITFSKSNKVVNLSVNKQKKIYDDIIYAIVIRSLAEIFHYDDKKYIEHICFNGKINDRSSVTGQMEEKYILSINVSREQIESLNLEFIDPKECFKNLKGVSASKLYEQTEIQPIITPSFNDRRFVKAKNIKTEHSTNLAEMDWEEFEHLVRQVFEWEFSDKGGEVNVTQSSRDGGVDAIVYDPDPIRGGKIIIQAKRYTNTVPVSAVRDLYGTIINEGANKGILITTSDYGPDSYKFAQGKPITLLNGGHLLYLMEKHGRHARIDIQEAKDNLKNKL